MVVGVVESSGSNPTSAHDELEQRFEAAMFEIYRLAKVKARYNATRFAAMLEAHGGLETARILLNSPNVSEGYTNLWERGHLRLPGGGLRPQAGIRATLHGG